MTNETRVVKVQCGAGPSVEFRSSPEGPRLASLQLGVLLEYTRRRSVNPIVKDLFGEGSASFRSEHGWLLAREDVVRVLQRTKNSPEIVQRVHAYFDAAVTLLASEGTGGAPTPRGPVVESDGPLTAREQLQLGQVRIEQARFVTALITARRLAKELTPKEHRRLAHKAAEIALGERIDLDDRLELSLTSVVPTSPSRPRTSLGAVVRAAQSVNPPTRAPAPVSPEPRDSPAVLRNPFDFEIPASPASVTSATALADAKAWVLTKYNPPHRATASELAYLVGFGCTRQKIGIEAARLGFKEGHPWVETKQVQGRHSLRDDCTVYYYNREASFALIEAVLTYPTKSMYRQMQASPGLPLDLFKVQAALGADSQVAE
jgi:hypothetical protein